MFDKLKRGLGSITKGVKKIFRKSSNRKSGGSKKYEKFLTPEMKDTLRNNPMIRKANLQKIPDEDIVKYFADVYPPEILDEKVPSDKRKKLGSHMKNTGVYLWKKGYDPEEVLGIGATAVAWKCKEGNTGHKVAKVTCNGSMRSLGAVSSEAHDVERVNEITRGISGADKYLFIPRQEDGKGDEENKDRGVFESDLADKGDLEHYKSAKKEYEKFLEILRIGVNVSEGLCILHDAGYSHNDVKPDNLFVITSTNARSAVSEADRIPEGKEVDVKLADFGAMTRFNDSIFKQKLFANRYFCPPDMQNLRSNAVAQRDVYSLGAILVFLFVGCSVQQARVMSKQLEKSTDLRKFCDSLKGKDGKRIGNLLMMYDRSCDSGRTNKILEFLKVVQKMVASSYKNRCTIQEANSELKKVSSMGDVKWDKNKIMQSDPRKARGSALIDEQRQGRTSG